MQSYELPPELTKKNGYKKSIALISVIVIIFAYYFVAKAYSLPPFSEEYKNNTLFNPIVETDNGHNYYLDSETGRSKQAEIDFADYFAQKIDWSACENSDLAKAHLRCAKIKVPLNWGDPSKNIAPDYSAQTNKTDSPIQQSIEIALTKSEATGFKRGSMLLNPGGPGGSGNEFLASFVSEIPSPLASAFDFVSFDPRGVSSNEYGSTAINCFDSTDEEFEDVFSSFDDSDPDAFENDTKLTQDFVNKCSDKTGALLNFVGTESVVYDMNLIRALLQDKRLNYVGFSYGTKLGQVFAGIFPERVGSFVLDGIVDPNATLISTTQDQSLGFEKVIDEFLNYCISQGSKCPFFELDSAHKRLLTTLSDLKDTPKKLTSGKKLNDTMFSLGLIAALYSESSWDYLVAGLNNYYKFDDARIIELFAYSYAEYSPTDNIFDNNQNSAFQVINCIDATDADRKLTLNDWQQSDEKIKQGAPVMSKILSGFEICSPYPKSGFSVEYDKSAPGSPDILLIGNLADPATPFKGAENLRNLLTRANLMTVSSKSHTAFIGGGIDDVDNAVTKFILNGEIPDDTKIFGEKAAPKEAA